MTAFHYRTQANEVNWGFTMLVVTRAGNLIEWLQRELLNSSGNETRHLMQPWHITSTTL